MALPSEPVSAKEKAIVHVQLMLQVSLDARNISVVTFLMGLSPLLGDCLLSGKPKRDSYPKSPYRSDFRPRSLRSIMSLRWGK